MSKQAISRLYFAALELLEEFDNGLLATDFLNVEEEEVIDRLRAAVQSYQEEVLANGHGSNDQA